MKKYIPILLLAAAACAPASSQQSAQAKNPQISDAVKTDGANTEFAIFAGGCFWCVEADFEKQPGVLEVVSGYTGGHLKDPTYKQVTRENTGHYEAAKIIYDPAKISYKQLVNYYWKTVDPTDAGGQFCDRGSSYRTAIFATPEQMATAKASKQRIQNSGILQNDVVTPILKAQTFYDAEEYHQDYYKKKPLKYKYYRNGCGRDKKLRQVWALH